MRVVLMFSAALTPDHPRSRAAAWTAGARDDKAERPWGGMQPTAAVGWAKVSDVA